MANLPGQQVTDNLPPLAQPGPRQADSPALAAAVALWNVLAMDRDKSWVAVGVALTQHPEMATWIVQARLSLP